MDLFRRPVQYRITLWGTEQRVLSPRIDFLEDVMKNAKWMLPAMLMLFSGLMAAQSLTQSTVVAKVPFNFMVGNKIIPSGETAVRAASPDGQTLAIRNFDARKSALAMSSREESTAASSSTVLVFKHYGDRYFLSSIQLKGSHATYELPESKAEAELRAQNVPATVEILMASLK
jgi:hypothetical protein